MPHRVVTFQRWHVVAAFIVQTVVYAVTAFALARLAEGGDQAHDALCTLRQERQRSVRASEKFLAAHPEGFATISAAEIRKGIRDQQKTIDALDELHCPDPIFD